jgi:NADPH-dependent F420 reductase
MMNVGILGGTGKEGAALALRLSKAGYAVTLGSRDANRAAEKAREIARASGGNVTGATNAEAAEHADLVIVAVPFEGHRELLSELKRSLSTKTVIDTVVPLDFKAAHTYVPPVEGSAAEQARALLGTRVVAALHQIAAHELASDHAIEADGFYCGDDAGAKEQAAALIRALGVRPVDAGGLKNASILEAMTPLLIEINKRHKVKSSGIKITGI